MTIEQELKALKINLNPTPDAIEGIRNTLTKRAHFLSSISHVKSVPLSMRLSVWQTYRFTFTHIRQVSSVVFIVLLSTGGTFMAKASLAAVSGDTLYPIKRNLLEKVELVLAPTAKDEANVYLKHVATRLDEIRVLNSRDIPDEEKSKRLNETVLSLNRDLTAASQSLQIAVSQETEPKAVQAVTQMAKKVAKSTADIRVALSSSSTLATNMDKSLVDAKLDTALAQTMTTVTQTEQSTLNILIAKVANDSNDKATIDAVERLLQEALDVENQRVVALKKPVWTSGNIEIRYKVRQAVNDVLREAGLVKIKLSDFDNLDDNLTQVQFALSEASIHLTWHRYERVVEQLNVSRDGLDNIENILKSTSVLIKVELLPGALKEINIISSSSTASMSTTTSLIATTTINASKKSVLKAEDVNETTVSSLKK